MGIVKKLIVEVIDARNLAPKDGHGTSSPYVILDFYGQRKKTRTMIRDLNPVWNETLEFNVGKNWEVFGDMLELNVYHDKNIGPTTRNNFLGRVFLSSRQFVKKGEEALIYYPLEKKHLFSWILGEIGLKIYFADKVVPPSPPPSDPLPPPEDVKPEQGNVAPPADQADPPPSVESSAKPDPSPPPEAPRGAEEPPPRPSVESSAKPDSSPPAEAPTPKQMNNLGGFDHMMASVASSTIIK